MSKDILLIDDDEFITEPTARRLTSRGYRVTVAHNGAEGLQIAATESPDLIILDIMMPVMDGWEVCRRIRETSVVPILMLTALNDEFDRVTGLELGADDYLSKPFDSGELLARVGALLRRIEFDRIHFADAVATDLTATTPSATQPKSLSIGQLSLNLETRQVTIHGDLIHLRFKEFELLALLMVNAGRAVTRAEIFDKVWGTDWLGDTRTLDVHIRWLREKLEADSSSPRYIHTVRNVGYRFTTAEEVAGEQEGRADSENSINDRKGS
ncbi:MAG: response regulator transcription factor [Chloroflexota bacterium]